jgi:serine protease inhibitor
MGDDRNDWLDKTLQPLRTSPSAHDWPGTDDVQRRGAQRRRRQRRAVVVSGGSGIALAVVLVVGLVSFSGGDHSRGPAKTALAGHIEAVAGPDGSVHLVTDVKGTSARVDIAGMSAVSKAEQEFAVQLTRDELSQSSNGNVLLSPMSADIDLAMLELGSAGVTAHEVATALQSSTLSSSAQAEGWSGLVQQLMTAESAGELHIANSLWVDKKITVRPQFLREAAATFGDDTYQVDFASNSATDAINAWVDQETAGRIKELYAPQELPVTTELVLANAMHFHAAWQQQLFAEASVQGEPFFTAAGSRVSVPMLTDTPQASLLASGTPAYDAVQLPYTNGRFAALLIEPTSGSMSSFLRMLSPAYLVNLTRSLRDEVVNLSMPELKLSARERLDAPLSAMGMGQAFETADFSPMLGPLPNQAVGGVQQAASLDVNKWGTDAAAATGVNAISTAERQAGITIAFDHPYLFLIRDTKTGTILFSGVINNPAAG